jgi:hypothetical protein
MNEALKPEDQLLNLKAEKLQLQTKLNEANVAIAGDLELLVSSINQAPKVPHAKVDFPYRKYLEDYQYVSLGQSLSSKLRTITEHLETIKEKDSILRIASDLEILERYPIIIADMNSVLASLHMLRASVKSLNSISKKISLIKKGGS